MVCETIRARVAAGTLLAAFLIAGSVPAPAAPTKNIVLVHVAWVDGSGWKPVYEILVRDGYHVRVVQEPLTSLQDDVAATKRIIDLRQARPSWLHTATVAPSSRRPERTRMSSVSSLSRRTNRMRVRPRHRTESAFRARRARRTR